MADEFRVGRKMTEDEAVLNRMAQALHDMNKKYTSIGLEIGSLVDEKNEAYGDSFTKAADFLKILYPNGIPVDAYTDALCIVRIFDKLMRLATSKDYNNERPYADIAGYAFLGLQKDRIRSDIREKRDTPIQPKEQVKISQNFLVNAASEEELRAAIEALASKRRELLPAEQSEGEEELSRPIVQKEPYKRIDMDRLR